MRLRIDNDVIAYQDPSQRTTAEGPDDANRTARRPGRRPKPHPSQGRPAPYKAFDRTLVPRFSVRGQPDLRHDGPVRLRKWLPCLRKPARRVEILPARQPVCGGRDGRRFSRHDGDSKISAAPIKINAEIALPQIISDGVAP